VDVAWWQMRRGEGLGRRAEGVGTQCVEATTSEASGDLGVMSLGRDESERIEGSRLIAVRPNSQRMSRNGARPHAHVETDALIIALSL
jgi:hypothetical protein